MATHAELVTPERVLYSGEAEFVVMRTEGGEVMFLPNHAPFVGAVDICVVRVAPAGTEIPGSSPDQGSGRAEEEVRAAVHGGFVHVADNRVLVLASVAELAGEIDVERARRALDAAEAAIGAGRDGGPGAGGAGGGAAGAAGAAGTAGTTGAGKTGAVEEGAQEEGSAESPAMLAMLHPDDPEVAQRRARARLEAAGVLEPVGAGTAGAQ